MKLGSKPVSSVLEVDLLTVINAGKQFLHFRRRYRTRIGAGAGVAHRVLRDLWQLLLEFRLVDAKLLEGGGNLKLFVVLAYFFAQGFDQLAVVLALQPNRAGDVGITSLASLGVILNDIGQIHGVSAPVGNVAGAEGGAMEWTMPSSALENAMPARHWP